MTNWKEVHLKEIYDDLIMGQSPDSATYNDDLIGLPFIQGNADMDGIYPKIRIYTTTPKRISEKEDILLSVRAPVGDLFINNVGNIAVGRGLCAIRIKNESLREYIFQYFNWEKKQFLRLQQGTTFTEIGKSEVRNLKVNIPENNKEIEYIAFILSKVDEAILATQNSIKAAEKLKKALMQNLLTGKLKPDGTWRTDDEFYMDEKFGKVPKGWEVCKVKDFGEIQTGKTPPTAEPNVFALDSKESYMFITPGDLGDKKYIKTTERYVTEKGIGYSYKIPVNSVFLVCIGSTIGKIGLNLEVACSNQQINALIPSEENDSEFFYYMMLYRSPHFKEIAGVNATPQINKSDYGKYKILRPKNKQEQKKMANKIAVFDTEIEQKQNKIETLQRLKKSLMQNLLTGKVRVDVEKILELCREK